MSTTALQINDTATGAVMGGLSAAGNVLADYMEQRQERKDSESWQQYAMKLQGQLSEAVTELDRRKDVIEKLEKLLKRESGEGFTSNAYIFYLKRRFALLENAFNRQSANVAAQSEIRLLLEEEVRRLADPAKFSALDPEVAEARMRAAWEKFMTTSSVISDLTSKPLEEQVEDAKSGGWIKTPVVDALVTPAARPKTKV